MSVTRQTQSDTSPAAASTVAGTPITGLDDFDSVVIFASIEGATGGVLDVFIQFFDGTDWIDCVHFTQLTDGGAAVAYVIPIDRRARPDDATPVVTGQGLVPLLAADAIVHGTLTDRLRFVFVAGVGTSAGVSQVMTVVGTKTLLDVAQQAVVVNQETLITAHSALIVTHQAFLDLTSPAG